MRRLSRLPILALSVGLLLLGAVHGAQTAPGESAQDPEARNAPQGQALFLQHCATCHGETGDGKGVTELDRPARSFRDGGFSFGNTPEALFRTISTGIPGTPMPGFDTAIDEAGRRAVARYVRSLGPPVDEADVSAAVLEVRDVPLVVRGHLPPIREGADAHPRGLLLGTTSGLTFEYRADDVRLLGIRQGAFVRRSDWSGRGGTPLEPLGPVIHTMHGGSPGALFLREDSGGQRPLTARLRSTWVRAGEVGLTYELRDEEGSSWARVDETVRAVATARASGFERALVIDATGAPASGAWTLAGDLVGPLGERLESQLDRSDAVRSTRTYRGEGNLVQVVSVAGGARVEEDRVQIEGGASREIVVTTLLCPDWSAETQAAVLAELDR